MLSILIVDDEPSFCVAFAQLLRQDNHVVHACGTYAEACEAIDKHTIDVALIDLELRTGETTLLGRPRSGVDVAQYCRRDTVCVLITGYDPETARSPRVEDPLKLFVTVIGKPLIDTEERKPWTHLQTILARVQKAKDDTRP